MTFWTGNTKNITENSGFDLAPEGEHILEIQEVKNKETRRGDPMAEVKFLIVDAVHSYANVYDNVIFPLPGSPAEKILGRSKHFLHCIGMPYDDENLEVDPNAWMFLRVKALLKHETYISTRDGNSRTKAVVQKYILDDAASNIAA